MPRKKEVAGSGCQCFAGSGRERCDLRQMMRKVANDIVGILRCE